MVNKICSLLHYRLNFRFYASLNFHKISMLNQVLLQVFSIGIHGFPRNFAHFVYTDIRQKRHKLRSWSFSHCIQGMGIFININQAVTRVDFIRKLRSTGRLRRSRLSLYVYCLRRILISVHAAHIFALMRVL